MPRRLFKAAAILVAAALMAALATVGAWREQRLARDCGLGEVTNGAGAGLPESASDLGGGADSLWGDFRYRLDVSAEVQADSGRLLATREGMTHADALQWLQGLHQRLASPEQASPFDEEFEPAPGAVASYREDTGELAWRRDIPVASRAVPHGAYVVVFDTGLARLADRPPPGAAGRAKPLLHGLDAATGDMLWCRPEAPVQHVWTDPETPGVLTVETAAEAAGVEAATGEELWRIDAPRVLAVGGGMAILWEQGLTARDLETGERLWGAGRPPRADLGADGAGPAEGTADFWAIPLATVAADEDRVLVVTQAVDQSGEHRADRVTAYTLDGVLEWSVPVGAVEWPQRGDRNLELAVADGRVLVLAPTEKTDTLRRQLAGVRLADGEFDWTTDELNLVRHLWTPTTTAVGDHFVLPRWCALVDAASGAVEQDDCSRPDNVQVTPGHLVVTGMDGDGPWVRVYRRGEP